MRRYIGGGTAVSRGRKVIGALGGGGGAALPAPSISGPMLTGLDAGIARIWSTIGYVATVTGDADGPTRTWLLDGGPMQGADGATIFVDASFNNLPLALQLDAENATDVTTAISPAAVVRYPVPLAAGALPALTGAVGDTVDIALAPYFVDGHPTSSANASLSYSATGLPAGLAISGNRIVGTYAAPVTAQAVSISATNSGGTAVQTSSATVSGGAFVYNYDFNLAGPIPTEWVTSDANLRLTIVPDDPAVGTYGSVGALLIEGFALPGGVAAAPGANVRRDYDVTNVADGVTYQVTICSTTQRVTTTGFTQRTRVQWINSAGAIMATPDSYVVSLAVATPGEKVPTDTVYTMTKPAGAVKLRVQVEVTNWTAGRAEIKKVRLDGGPVAVPTVASVAIVGDGKVGSVHTAEVTMNPPGSAYTLAWLRNGAPIPGELGSTYTPVVADDTTGLTLRATPTAAGGVAVPSQAVAITRPGPVVSGVSLTPAAAAPGATLTYSVGAATNGATATFTLRNGETVVASGAASGTYVAATAGTYRLDVVWTNSGGAVSNTRTTVVEAPAVGQAIIVYDNSFASDRRADFLNPTASLAHAPGLTFANDTPGAMTFGTLGVNYETNQQRHAVIAGHLYEVFSRARLDATTGAGTMLRVLRWRDAALAQIGAAISTTAIGEWANTLTAPAGAAFLDTEFQHRIAPNNGRLVTDPVTGITETKPWLYQIHYVNVADITESGPSPTFTKVNAQFWADNGYVGVPNPPVNISAAFAGTVTGYTYEGPEPHTWAGSVLTITPAAVTPGYIARNVVGNNNALKAKTPSVLPISVVADPGPLVANLTRETIPVSIEVNKQMPVIDAKYYVSGGCLPFTYSIVSKPAWVNVTAFGLADGKAPAAPAAASNLVLRVTDRRGQTVDLTFPITVIAARSVITTTIAPTADLAAAAAAFKTPGAVIQLQAGIYSAGSFNTWYVGSQNNPVTFRGVAGTKISGINFKNAAGITFENVEFEARALPANLTPSTALVNLRGSADIVLRNCTFTGWTSTDITGDVALPWITSETFAHYWTGIWAGGVRSVIENPIVRRVYEAITLYDGRGVGVYNADLGELRDDGIVVYGSTGSRIKNPRIRSYTGNYKSADHHDHIQTAGDVPPVPNRLYISGTFGSSRSWGNVQMMFTDQDKFDNVGDRTEEYCNSDFLFEDCAHFGSSSHGLALEFWRRGSVNRFVALSHPDNPGALIPIINHRRPSQVAISNVLYHSIGGDAHNGVAGDWRHLITLTNGVTVPAFNVAAMTAIFPNWSNTGALYEDPRDAVLAGQAASVARFWINPAGAWHLANPNVGPAWLRTGAMA